MKGKTLAAALVAAGLANVAATGPSRTPETPPATALGAELSRLAPGLRRAVIDRALQASACARERGIASDSPILTVIDYSKPSTEERLWIFDLADRRMIYEGLVAHGSGTGEDFARYFSNDPSSHQTSLGLFRTGEVYVGSKGYSLRLDGLEPGYNDRARSRAIVVHGAPYVSRDFARAHGRLGRSWGCPTLAASDARQVIDAIRGGTLLFAYGPDARWLEGSTLLRSCEPPAPEQTAGFASHQEKPGAHIRAGK
jgi:hypothetical protein